MKTERKWEYSYQGTGKASVLMRSYVLLGLVCIYIWCLLPGNHDLQGFPLQYWKFIPDAYYYYLALDGLQYALTGWVFMYYGHKDEYYNEETNHLKGMIFLHGVFLVKVLLFLYIVLGG